MQPCVWVLNTVEKIPIVIEVFYNLDSLPLAKRSGSSFWLILGMVDNVLNSTSFFVGNIHGFQKPSSENSYLDAFVKEAVDFTQKELIASRACGFQIINFILDTPAKTFVMN